MRFLLSIYSFSVSLQHSIDSMVSWMAFVPYKPTVQMPTYLYGFVVPGYFLTFLLLSNFTFRFRPG